MHHSFLDRYSAGSSPIHRMDSRIKILLSVIALICLLTLPHTPGPALAAYGIITAALWAASGLPVSHLAKRLALALPFIAVIALGAFVARGDTASWIAYLALVTKALLAIMILTLLTSTTPFPQLLHGFGCLGMPRIMRSLLAFLYRYIYIIFDEAERLSMGRRSRQFAPSRVLAWKSRAWMIGTLFLRSLDRSERVYRAMLARGFTGDMKTLAEPRRLAPSHIVSGTALATLLIAIRIVSYHAPWSGKVV